MPVRVRALSPAALESALRRLDDASRAGRPAPADDERAAVKHFLAVLVARHPGRSVEVRVPPYAAVQCVAGTRHTRGTPPAVVETDAQTWLAVARGLLGFDEARADGRIHASGQRSDLTPLLPLI